MKKLSIVLLAFLFIGITNINAQTDETTETVVAFEEVKEVTKSKTCAKTGKICDVTCKNKAKGTCCNGVKSASKCSKSAKKGCSKSKASCSKSNKKGCSKSKSSCSKSKKGSFNFDKTNKYGGEKSSCSIKTKKGCSKSKASCSKAEIKKGCCKKGGEKKCGNDCTKPCCVPAPPVKK